MKDSLGMSVGVLTDSTYDAVASCLSVGVLVFAVGGFDPEGLVNTSASSSRRIHRATAAEA